MNGNDLDRSITGNWGEDSVAPEFITARDLAYLGTEVPTVIDIAPQADEKQIPVTVTKISITSGMVYVETEELAWTLVIPEGDTVYFADDER